MPVVAVAIETTNSITAELIRGEPDEIVTKLADSFRKVQQEGELIETLVVCEEGEDRGVSDTIEKAFFKAYPEFFHEDYEWVTARCVN